ncbi:MAG TPA: hypothetical protein VNI60_12615 [Pyrinomonadaceae bacterium]|nr:hypothetical protein [Pyrinomonadaceae bacterium]
MKTNKAKDSLRGLVKDVHAKTATVSRNDDDVREEFPFIRFSRYDTVGNKIEESHYNPDNSLLFKVVYNYDANGKLVEQTNFDADSAATFKTVYEYDANGKLIERKSLLPDGSAQNIVRPVYTAEGLRVEEEKLPVFETPDEASFCLVDIDETDAGFSARGGDCVRKVYDVEERLIEIDVRGAKGKLAGKILLEYDAGGRLIETSQFGGEESFQPRGDSATKRRRVLEFFAPPLIKTFLLFKSVYNFARRGKWRKAARCFLYSPFVMSTAYVYDEKGQKIEEQTSFLGSPMMKKVYAYDEKGDKAEEIEYFDNGDSVLQKLTYSREYDLRGNWIKETILCQSHQAEKREQSTVVTRRNISYYPDAEQ